MINEDLLEGLIQADEEKYVANVPSSVRQAIEPAVDKVNEAYRKAVEAAVQFRNRQSELENLISIYKTDLTSPVGDLCHRALTLSILREMEHDEEDRFARKQKLVFDAAVDKLNHTRDAVASWLRHNVIRYAGNQTELFVQEYLRAFPEISKEDY